jgi:hypothetical protein
MYLNRFDHILIASSVAVAFAAEHVLQMAHPASALGASALGLGAPVVCGVKRSGQTFAHLLGREGAGSAAVVLDVIRALAAPHTNHMGFVVLLTSRSCAFCLYKRYFLTSIPL